MKLSVVILNYNVRYFLEQCIRSVEKAIAGLDAEIIVIDNDSKDGSCEMVKTLFPNVILIENKENVGFSKANNQAVKKAKGKYICILNPDTVVPEDCFKIALNYYKKQSDIGALGVYLMDGTGNFLPESKRNFPSPKISLLKLLGRDSGYYAKHITPEKSGEVEVLVGAFMLMTKKIYDEVGGFDEDYFMYGEDIDLSYKIIKAGYKNHYSGETSILHYKGESTQRDDSYYDRFYGAMEIFYAKHLGQSVLEKKIISGAVFLAKWANRNLKSSKKPNKSVPKNYFVITENNVFLQKLETHYQSAFHKITPSDLEMFNPENSFVVFDSDCVSYAEIFKMMRKFNRSKNQFRISPPNSDFILGSDRSDEKGEVVLFSTN